MSAALGVPADMEVGLTDLSFAPAEPRLLVTHVTLKGQLHVRHTVVFRDVQGSMVRYDWCSCDLEARS